MARSASKSKGGSLAAMAAALDTRKRPLPPDAKPGPVAALRAEVKARGKKDDVSPASLAGEVKSRAAAQAAAEKKTAAPSKSVAGSKPGASKPTVAASKPAVVASKSAVVASKPAIVTSKPAVVTSKPAVVASTQVVVASKSSVVASKPAAITQRPAPERRPEPSRLMTPAGAVMGPSKPGPTARLPERPAVSMTVSRPEPRPLAAAMAARPDVMLGRTAALSSLNKSPSSPAKTPVTEKPLVLSTDPRRRYPRASLGVRARLSLADDPSRVFEATLPTVNISVGGMFLESSFFLKMGTRLLVELKLPPKGREVHVKADVVRIETNGSDQSGFALRFTEYLDGSEVVLATHFLSPVLREFITAYAKKHRFEAGAEYIAHTADVLAAWELKKAELGGDVWSLTSL